MLCQPSGEAMTERKTLRGTPAMREALGIRPEPVPAPPAPALSQPKPAEIDHSGQLIVPMQNMRVCGTGYEN